MFVRDPEGAHEEVAARLGRGIGTVRLETVLLVRFPFREGTVDLICRHMDKPFDPTGAGRFKERRRAEDVRLQEFVGTGDRTVNMRFGREMDDRIDPRHDFRDEFFVADIALHEGIAGVLGEISQVLGIPGIAKLVQVDNRIPRTFFHDKADEIGTDEAAPARNEKPFHLPDLPFFLATKLAR